MMVLREKLDKRERLVSLEKTEPMVFPEFPEVTEPREKWAVLVCLVLLELRELRDLRVTMDLRDPRVSSLT